MVKRTGELQSPPEPIAGQRATTRPATSQPESVAGRDQHDEPEPDDQHEPETETTERREVLSDGGIPPRGTPP
jgi:hypothetical protein